MGAELWVTQAKKMAWRWEGFGDAADLGASEIWGSPRIFNREVRRVFDIFSNGVKGWLVQSVGASAAA